MQNEGQLHFVLKVFSSACQEADYSQIYTRMYMYIKLPAYTHTFTVLYIYFECT